MCRKHINIHRWKEKAEPELLLKSIVMLNETGITGNCNSEKICSVLRRFYPFISIFDEN